MAAKRGLSDAIKGDGPNISAGAQLRANTGNAASGDVDALVSDFLEQLTAISSEIEQHPDQERDTGLTSAAVSGVPAAPQKEEALDFEKSLRAIENELRKSTEGLPQGPSPENQIPAENTVRADPFSSAQRANSTKQQEQERDVPELSRRIFSSQAASKKSINRIVSSGLMIGIFGIAGLYLFLKLKPWENPSKPVAVASSTALGGQRSAAVPGVSQGTTKIEEPARERQSSAKTETASDNRSRLSALTDNYIKKLREAKSGSREKRSAQNQADSTNPPSTRQVVASSGRADQPGASAAQNTVPVSEAPPPAAPALNPATPQISRNSVNTVPTVSQPAPFSVAPNTTAVAPVSATPRDSGLAVPPPVSPKRPDEIKTPDDSNASNASRSIAVQAVCLTRVQPVYPELARKQNVSGRVEVETEISDKGNVMSAKATSGPVLLRRAAEDAVMKWKFRPASVNGSNVTSKASIIVDFRAQ